MGTFAAAAAAVFCAGWGSSSDLAAATPTTCAAARPARATESPICSQAGRSRWSTSIPPTRLIASPISPRRSRATWRRSTRGGGRSKVDILYPYVGGSIDQLVLDVNHDDYYGNGGAFDVRNSPWLERLDLPRVPLAVTTDGSGRVTSDAGAIDCPGACTTAQEQGLVVTLKASAAQGSHFAGWSGACSGTGACTITLDAVKDVGATFAVGAPLKSKVSVRGKGKVVSTQSREASVTLRAVPAKGYRFASWSGACHGRSTCTIKAGAAVSVRATFARL